MRFFCALWLSTTVDTRLTSTALTGRLSQSSVLRVRLCVVIAVGVGCACGLVC